MSKKNGSRKAARNSRRGNMNRDMIGNFVQPQEHKIQYESVKESHNVAIGLDALKKMYTIHSPSGKEDNLADYLISVLNRFQIPHFRGEQGEIYNITPNRPLICAHMDQVQREMCDFTIQHHNFIYGMGGHQQAGLGADDKNGVWIALNLILRHNVSFVFSTMEEVGRMTDGFMSKLGKDVTDNIPYALIFDRKGSGDIIGVKNEYCMIDFQDDIAEIGKDFGYAPAVGVWSDCDHISKYVPCVNLSCGYYAAHTNGEYTNVNELINALDFGNKILEVLEEKWYNRVIKKEDILNYRVTQHGTWVREWANKQVDKWEDRWEESRTASKIYDLFDWEGVMEDEKQEYIENNTIIEYIEDDAIPNDEFVFSNYQKFEVIQGEDGFYLSVDGELINLTDMTEIQFGTVLEVYITDKFRIVIGNIDGYDVYLEHDDYKNFMEEITYRDGRV